jgi:hypothetical protein
VTSVASKFAWLAGKWGLVATAIAAAALLGGFFHGGGLWDGPH